MDQIIINRIISFKHWLKQMGTSMKIKIKLVKYQDLWRDQPQQEQHFIKFHMKLNLGYIIMFLWTIIPVSLAHLFQILFLGIKYHLIIIELIWSNSNMKSSILKDPIRFFLENNHKIYCQQLLKYLLGHYNC